MQGTSTTKETGDKGSGTSARETANQLGEKAHAGIDRLTKSAHGSIDRVASNATSAADRFSDGRVAHTAQEWCKTTSAYVREHPMAAIGIAAVAGYLLSRLTSSR